MKLKEEEVVGFLSKEYGGPVAARGLWTWAGGETADMVFPKPAVEQWKKLWELAGEDTPPSRIALLREALFDHPGNDTILGFLDAVSDDEFPNGRPAAAVIFFLFDKLVPPFEAEGLRSAMTSFPFGLIDNPEDPNPPSVESLTDTMFAALASSFQNQYNNDNRALLEEKCRGLIDENQPVSIERLTAGMTTLLKHLPEMAGLSKTPEVEELVKELKKAVKPLAGTKKEQFPDIPAQARPILNQLKTHAEKSGDSMFKAVCISLDYQFQCLKAISENIPLRSFQCLAKAVIQSLWGTNGI